MKLSVLITTYKQESYIAQCIEGVLAQKFSLDWEVLIGVDHSDDKTLSICQSYQALHPQLIRVILNDSKKQVFINGQRCGRANFFNILSMAAGEYVAVCDGDDYWTDPEKLLKQVDFLDAHPEYSMCGTNYSDVDEHNNLLKEWAWVGDRQMPVMTQEMILGQYIPKLITVVFRKKCLPEHMPKEFFQSPNGDGFLCAMIAERGAAAYLDFMSACYRINKDGVWSSKSSAQRMEMQLKAYFLMKACFRGKHQRRAISNSITSILGNLIRLEIVDRNYIAVVRNHLRLFLHNLRLTPVTPKKIQKKCRPNEGKTKATLKRMFLGTEYRLRREWRRREIRSEIEKELAQNEQIFLIFTKGKVGSVSMEHSLQASGANGSIFRLHFLTQERLSLALCKEKRLYPRCKLIKDHLLVSEYFQGVLKNGAISKKLKVITGVRDPVAGGIAGFFQTLDQHSEFDLLEWKNLPEDQLVERLVSVYQKSFFTDGRTSWFDNEFKPVLNLDVYASKFLPEQGYSIYRGKHPETLLIRLESLNECAPRAFKEFLGIKSFTVSWVHQSQDKPYFNLYDKFLKRIVFSQEYLDRVYTSRYVTHFYSANEISRFRQKWSRQTSEEKTERCV